MTMTIIVVTVNDHLIIIILILIIISQSSCSKKVTPKPNLHAAQLVSALSDVMFAAPALHRYNGDLYHDVVVNRFDDHDNFALRRVDHRFLMILPYTGRIIFMMIVTIFLYTSYMIAIFLAIITIS